MKLCIGAPFLIALCLSCQDTGAHSIQRSDKLTIVKFEPSDFKNSDLAQQDGWSGEFAFKSPAFDLPESSDSELEIIWTLSGSWQGEFKTPCEFADHHLGVLELNYEDRFGNPQFEPKVIRPSHLGSADCVRADGKDCSAMKGDTRGQWKTITHGPFIIKAGAKKIQVGLTDIAPHTRFELKGLEIRFRPVK